MNLELSPTAAPAASAGGHAGPWRLRFWSIWLGQALSLIGSALTQFVLIWWITLSSGSTSALAIAGVMALLPQALLGPLGGTLADRYSRRAIMIVTDTISAACMLVLIWLFQSEQIQLWHLYSMMFIRSSMQAFQAPAAAGAAPEPGAEPAPGPRARLALHRDGAGRAAWARAGRAARRADRCARDLCGRRDRSGGDLPAGVCRAQPDAHRGDAATGRLTATHVAGRSPEPRAECVM